jgi:hypothetical protein
LDPELGLGMALILPPTMDLKDHGGDWNPYFELVHRQFLADFVPCRFKCLGKRVSARLNPPSEGKSPCFWHLISEGPEEEERTPDLRRCERIGWVRPVIEAAGTNDVRTWREDGHKGDKRLMVATPDFDYIVVLVEKADHFLVITAYHVEHDHRRAKFKRRWNDASGT